MSQAPTCQHGAAERGLNCPLCHRFKHAIPLGAEVIYRGEGMRARMFIVQHSRDCDGSPLYMAAQKPVAVPDSKYVVYSMGYLCYRLHVGFFVGNVDSRSFEPTGRIVGLERFNVERYEP